MLLQSDISECVHIKNMARTNLFGSFKNSIFDNLNLNLNIYMNLLNNELINHSKLNIKGHEI